MDIYDRINQLLKEKNTTRTQLSAETGISYNTITAMFQRRSKNLELDTVKKIAKYLDTTLEYLISGNEMFKEANPSHTCNTITIVTEDGSTIMYRFPPEQLQAILTILDTMTKGTK